MLHINVQQQLGRLTLRADLQLPTQGVTAIFGLSGSGKTSLINLVSGLTHPDEGFTYSKMPVYFRITTSKAIYVMA